MESRPSCGTLRTRRENPSPPAPDNSCASRGVGCRRTGAPAPYELVGSSAIAIEFQVLMKRMRVQLVEMVKITRGAFAAIDLRSLGVKAVHVLLGLLEGL